MQQRAIKLAINRTIEHLLDQAIELEAALDVAEDESRQWLMISDELNDVRQEIAWHIAHEYKQLRL